MRLIHTKRLELEEFIETRRPRYAILSHRWSTLEQEVLYTDFIHGRKTSSSGYAKITKFCEVARLHGYEYCWVDTCCIDRTSSAELSEAINSMFTWYSDASMCFAYLQDVDSISDLAESEWFTRGWTLQELVAPILAEFFNKLWEPICSRHRLEDQISKITAIPKTVLDGSWQLDRFSVAQKMSWAARRETSRVEDQAYSLMGLFGVHMPILYGEGANAFRRLQEQILAHGGDHSLFAWDRGSIDDPKLACYASLLAYSVTNFQGCDNMWLAHTGENQKILIETCNRGMTILIHRSYDRKVLKKLLQPRDTKDYGYHLILTLPLDCLELTNAIDTDGRLNSAVLSLQLVFKSGKWHRAGLIRHYHEGDLSDIRDASLAYENEFVRIYVPHNPDWGRGRDLIFSKGTYEWLHLRHDCRSSVSISRSSGADHQIESLSPFRSLVTAVAKISIPTKHKHAVSGPSKTPLESQHSSKDATNAEESVGKETTVG